MIRYGDVMERLQHTADCLEALGNPTRLSIYVHLVRFGNDGQPVGKLQELLGIPGSTLSHHLKALETQGLVVRRKEGTTHFCSANFAALTSVLEFLTEHCCIDSDDPDHDAHRGQWPNSVEQALRRT